MNNSKNAKDVKQDLKRKDMMNNINSTAKNTNTKERILKALEGETTNQIKINIKNLDDAYDLFEKIQNKYSLYDNCVIDEEKNNYGTIVIEGKNINQINSLAKELSKEYNIKPKIISVSINDTIVEKDRQEETGGFEV